MWIQVLCFSQESKSLIGTYEFEDRDLPEHFEPGMGLSLEGTQWYIISAKPARASDYRHTKEVTLMLSSRQPRRLPTPRPPRQPGEVSFDRYSMATMCATLPPRTTRGPRPRGR